VNTDPYGTFKQSGTAQSMRLRAVMGPTSPTPAQAIVVGANNGPGDGDGVTYAEQHLGVGDINSGTIADVTLTVFGTPPVGESLVCDVQLSTDGGNTFASIYSTLSPLPTIAPGQHKTVWSYDGGAILASGAILRPYVLQCGSAATAIECSILLFYEA
jgi:hypothetical protein